MADGPWRRIRADGVEWEVRVLANVAGLPDSPTSRGAEVLEFRSDEALRPPRRVAVAEGSLPRMTDRELRAAFRLARPTGGDHYGRPGKRMGDVAL